MAGARPALAVVGAIALGLSLAACNRGGGGGDVSVYGPAPIGDPSPRVLRDAGTKADSGVPAAQNAGNDGGQVSVPAYGAPPPNRDIR